MNDISNKKIVLKLNRAWQRIHIATVQSSIADLVSGVVEALDIEYNVNEDGSPDFSSYKYINPVNWDEWSKLPVYPWHMAISSPRMKIRVPTVVITKNYAKVRKKFFTGKPTKETLAMRDNLIDAYSGKELEFEEATIDHVIPRHRGGTDTYDNTVLTTKETNNRKGHQLNSECGLTKMFVNPHTPSPIPISRTIRKARHVDWGHFIEKE